MVEQARRAPGCLDFAITADLVDPGRIDVYERWETHAAVEVFRGSGPSDDQAVLMLSASVAEYDVAGARSLTWPTSLRRSGCPGPVHGRG